MNPLSISAGVSILASAVITGAFVAGTSENDASNAPSTSTVTADVEAGSGIDAGVMIGGSEDPSLDTHANITLGGDANVKAEPTADVEANVNADANVKADVSAEGTITVVTDADSGTGASFSATGDAGTMDDSDADEEDEPVGSTQILGQTGLNADGSIELGRSELSLDAVVGVGLNSKLELAP